MSILNITSEPNLDGLAQIRRERSKTWRDARYEYENIKEYKYQDLPVKRVDSASLRHVLCETQDHLVSELEGGINALANPYFMIEYEVRANIDGPAKFEPDTDGITFTVDWNKSSVDCQLYTGVSTPVILPSGLKAMIDTRVVKNLTKFSEDTGLNMARVRNEDSHLVNSAIQGLAVFTRGQNKLTRLVKGCLMYLDHLGKGAVRYEIPRINVLEYSVQTIVKELDSQNTAYVWSTSSEMKAMNSILYYMCKEYPNRVFNSSAHITIPADAKNVVLVGQSLREDACVVNVSADLIWGTLLHYCENFKLGGELESALAIACSLHQNRYLQMVRLPRVVSSVDLVYPAIGYSPKSLTDKTEVNIDAAVIFGRVHQMLILVLMKEIMTSAENSSELKDLSMDSSIKNLLSRDSYSMLSYIENQSVANILKITSGMRWIDCLDEDRLAYFRGFSVFEGIWLIKYPREVLKDGIIKCLKKGYKRSVELNKIGFAIDTFRVLKKEMELGGVESDLKIPNGGYNITLAGLRHGWRKAKRVVLPKRGRKAKVFYEGGVPVDDLAGGLLPCKKDVPGRSERFGWSGNDNIPAPAIAPDLSRVANLNKDKRKDDVETASTASSEDYENTAPREVGDITGTAPMEEDVTPKTVLNPKETRSGVSPIPEGDETKKDGKDGDDDSEYDEEIEVTDYGVSSDGKFITIQGVKILVSAFEDLMKNQASLLAEAERKREEAKKEEEEKIRREEESRKRKEDEELQERERLAKEAEDALREQEEMAGRQQNLVEEENLLKISEERMKEILESDSPNLSYTEILLLGKLQYAVTLDEGMVSYYTFNGIPYYVLGVEPIEPKDNKDIMERFNKAWNDTISRYKSPGSTPKAGDKPKDAGAVDAGKATDEPKTGDTTPKSVTRRSKYYVPPPKKGMLFASDDEGLDRIAGTQVDRSKETLSAFTEMSMMEFLRGNYKFGRVVSNFRSYLLELPYMAIRDVRLKQFKDDPAWQKYLLENAEFYYRHDKVKVEEYPEAWQTLVETLRREIADFEASRHRPSPSEELIADYKDKGAEGELFYSVLSDVKGWKPKDNNLTLEDLRGVNVYLFNNPWWMEEVEKMFKVAAGTRQPTSIEMEWAAKYLDGGGKMSEFHKIWKAVGKCEFLNLEVRWHEVVDKFGEISKECKRVQGWSPKWTTTDEAHLHLALTGTPLGDPKKAGYTKDMANKALREMMHIGYHKQKKLLAQLIATRKFITHPMYYMWCLKMHKVPDQEFEDLANLIGHWMNW